MSRDDLRRALGDDAAGRDDESLAAEQQAVSKLLAGMPAPRADISAAVMRRLEEPTWRELLFGHRQLTLRWNLASALALVVILGAGVLLLLATAPGADDSATLTRPGVTLVYVGPAAKDVTVAGDWNGWQTAAHRLGDADGDGVWTVELQLEPGRYEYMFVVDGQWVTDPLARSRRPDGFGRENALLEL